MMAVSTFLVSLRIFSFIFGVINILRILSRCGCFYIHCPGHPAGFFILNRWSSQQPWAIIFNFLTSYCFSLFTLPGIPIQLEI